MNLRNDFPIIQNNPGLVYLDNTASVQKPKMVIDEITRFLSCDYSNIHRGSYSLAERSEHIYEESKKIVARHIGANDWREVVYTANSNYALNLLAGSLRRSGFFQKGDVVLVSIVEHHANIVPWLILKEEIGIEVKYIQVKEDYSLDFDDLESKLDERVKVVSLTHVSNVTGEVFDLERVGDMLKNRFLPSQE
jgi:cysteine desulfurase / selenocysteine lyase